MIDKTTADWQDVKKVRKFIEKAKNMQEINGYIANLSHNKYPTNLTTIHGHEQRQKYRRWLKKKSWIQLKKTKKKWNKHTGTDLNTTLKIPKNKKL